MANSAVLRVNERAKAVSNMFFNLGSALVGAAVVKVYSKPVLDVAFGLWIVGGAMLIWLGWLCLSLVESEG
jgi:hypothetical protein